MFYKSKAIVIGSKKLSDTDLLITLFSQDKGKIVAVAKGARSSKSKLSAGVQAFTFGKFNLTSGSSWQTVSSVDVMDAFYGIREDLKKYAYGSYIMELIQHVVLEGEEQFDLFNLLVETIHAIHTTENYELIKLTFELKLLKYLGFKPNVLECINCGNNNPLKHYFHGAAGGILCENCASGDQGLLNIGKTLPKLIEYLSEKDIRIILKTEINDVYLRKLDIIINGYIKYHLEIKTFKSMDFLKTMR